MYRKIVVKLGTGVLTKGTRFLNQPQMVELTRQIASLHLQNKELIVCSSGAQAAGRARLRFPELPTTLSSRQMLAAVGQSRLMLLWERFFEIYSIHVGQILLTGPTPKTVSAFSTSATPSMPSWSTRSYQSSTKTMP